jgi:uncharacterized protein YbjT (DUF2867 family)
MAINSLLVFGATGTQGHPVVDAALDAGLSVRAATRRVDDAAEKLSSRAEIVEADLNDAGQVAEAMDGVDAVFFHLPILPDAAQAPVIVNHLLNAARHHRLQRLVFTTGGYCGDDMPRGDFVNGMRLISQSMLQADVNAVVLRPTLYLANLVWPHIIREIREYGKLSYPPLSGRRRLNWTATEDQGVIAVACLQADVVGEVIDIASPQAVSGPELCRMLSSVYGREVHFAPQSIDEFADTLSHLAGSAQVGRSISELYAGIDQLPGHGPLVDTDALQQRFNVELTPVSEWIDDRLGALLEMYG